MSIPTTDAGLKAFGLNCASLSLATPAAFGLVIGDATTIDVAVQDYAAKYDAAMNPATRTPLAILAKDEAKAALTSLLRGFARQIKNDLAVSAVDKASLGLPPDDLQRTPVTAPTTRPQITISGVDARQQVLRFADVTTPDSRLKPAGVLGLQLFWHVADAPPADPLVSRFQRLVTRQPARIAFAQEDVGKTAWYYARWYTRSGLFGPLSQVASMVVAG